MTSGTLLNIKFLRLRFFICKIETAIPPPKLVTRIKANNIQLKECVTHSKYWKNCGWYQNSGRLICLVWDNVLKWQRYLSTSCKYLIHKVIKQRKQTEIISFISISLILFDLTQTKYQMQKTDSYLGPYKSLLLPRFYIKT